MSKLKKMFEQHREKGRFVPVLPRNVQNTPGVSPRDTFSQNVKKHTKMKYDIHKEDTEMKEEKKMKGPDPCWKGYEMIGKKMKNGRSVPNCVPVKEDKDPHEYADGEMSIHQLKQIKAHADWILEMLKPDTDMPEWVQAKITLAADYLSTACDYLHVEMNEEVRGVYKDIKKIRDRKSINESDLPTTTAKEKIVTVRHKTSGKELVIVHNAVEKYKKLGYEPVNEQSNPFTRPGDNFQSKGKVPEPHSQGMKKEEVVDEMAGANMDTRAVHKHLKKGGWNLTRTSGGHDVFTHQKSSQHIAVPRHRQLKAPLIRGILKTASSVNESKTASIARGILMRKIDTMKLLKTPKPAQPKEPQKPAEPKMTTEELSRKAQIVKKAAKKVKDKFEADPVITQTAVKTVNGY